MENIKVCIPNISGAERRKRLDAGIISLVIAFLILSILTVFGTDRWWRLLLLPLFALAATGYFQWSEKTCIALSARGTRKLGDAEEKITDQMELAAVKQQARTVQIKSWFTSVLITLLVLSLPVR